MGTLSPGTMKKTDYMLSEAMIRLLEKRSFKKISVNDICQEAMVSRSAFYQHFADKYALLSFCMENQLRIQSEQLMRLPMEQAISVMLGRIQSNQRLLYHLFQADLNQELMEIFMSAFRRHVRMWIEQIQASGMELCESVDRLTAFLAGGLAGTVISWIQEDFATPIETLARGQCELTLRTLGLKECERRACNPRTDVR